MGRLSEARSTGRASALCLLHRKKSSTQGLGSSGTCRRAARSKGGVNTQQRASFLKQELDLLLATSPFVDLDDQTVALTCAPSSPSLPSTPSSALIPLSLSFSCFRMNQRSSAPTPWTGVAAPKFHLVRDPAGRICSSSPSPAPQVPPAGAPSPPLPRAKSSARTAARRPLLHPALTACIAQPSASPAHCAVSPASPPTGPKPMGEQPPAFSLCWASCPDSAQSLFF